jgi:hypothetical protein
MSWIARAATVAVIVGDARRRAPGPALGDTGNFGQQVRTYAHMMFPYDLNSHGASA